MEKDELLKLARKEAMTALNLSEEPGLRFERRGGKGGWDEAVYKNVFEAKFRVWRAQVIAELELNADTGEVLAYREVFTEPK
jgi:hypothetical protein